ncbi:MAG TPA: VCBS repeat-containing protein [Phycisphaerae bacterium]|nr:VCBS repeat-containing protein [Phycisphaerae bacterium]
MRCISDPWEMTIIDGAPPVAGQFGLGSLAAGDVDGDGNIEVFTAGEGALLWYRPATGDRGVVTEGSFHVGLTIGDVDGDGRLEVVAGEQHGDPAKRTYAIGWYKPDPADLHAPWRRFAIDAAPTGGSHDVLVVDIDGDGRNEVIAGAYGGEGPAGVFIYHRGDDPRAPWQRYTVQRGCKEEGLAAADLDGDGRIEIVSGPCVYFPPAGGALAGPWRRTVFAPAHREMNRVRLIDITGTGRPDIVIVDSEYFEGQLSWFENRLADRPDDPWVELRLERGLVYAHSLHVRREGEAVKIFVAEMAGGGWNAPYNYDARLIEYATADRGQSWQRTLLDQGQGTHEATVVDVDGDGQLEIVGKEWRVPRVQIWKKPAVPSPIAGYRHRFIDRDKPDTGTDILAADVTGDGTQDVVCGRWWYRAGDWQRFEIPGVCQVINAHDIDGDGRVELIGLKPAPGSSGGYGSLSSRLVWLKAIDPAAGKWAEHPIGDGVGDWPHGSCVAPLLPGGKLALVTAYHSAHSSPDGGEHYPDLFEVPDDPASGPWPRRTLAPIRYGEQIVPCDITGSGRCDLVAGADWLENLGDGSFRVHRIVRDASFYPARVGVGDIAGNGRADVVLGQEAMDYPSKHVPFSLLAWFECPADPRDTPWPMHVIDRVRCAHSIGVADIDGDGQPEIIAGEHDPFYPYRNRCRLFVYKRADPAGLTWKRYQLDDRFEHHDGTQIIQLPTGRLGIISHGWKDSLYVHLWEPR